MNASVRVLLRQPLTCIMRSDDDYTFTLAEALAFFPDAIDIRSGYKWEDATGIHEQRTNRIAGTLFTDSREWLTKE